jgi:secondary thiamine-phosphate synthase enzyme
MKGSNGTLSFMMIYQQEITLSPKSRGFHLITREVENHLGQLPEKGILHLFIKHTSAGLSINENADPSVRVDFETIFNNLVPENSPEYIHNMEGPDDMPAHVKSTLTGTSVSLPITHGRLNLGTWQGIYLCEFRNNGGSRKLVATVYS